MFSACCVVEYHFRIKKRKTLAIKTNLMPINTMALHAARVIRQRHKADSDHIETDISPEQRKNLEDAFEAADKNGDGVLSADEYYEIFQTHGLTIGRDLCSLYYVLNGIDFYIKNRLTYFKISG